MIQVLHGVRILWSHTPRATAATVFDASNYVGKLLGLDVFTIQLRALKVPNGDVAATRRTVPRVLGMQSVFCLDESEYDFGGPMNHTPYLGDSCQCRAHRQERPCV